MTDTGSSRARYWLGIGIPVLVGALLVAYTVRHKGQDGGLELQQVPREQAVDELPQGLPFDPDGTILENFTASDGRGTQFTRVYATGETLDEHRGAYTAYFEENGWEVLDETSAEGRATLFAQKDALQLMVAFDRVVAPTVTTVNVTLLQAPAQAAAQ